MKYRIHKTIALLCFSISNYFWKKANKWYHYCLQQNWSRMESMYPNVLKSMEFPMNTPIYTDTDSVKTSE